jgi:hypothetical protein
VIVLALEIPRMRVYVYAWTKLNSLELRLCTHERNIPDYDKNGGLIIRLFNDISSNSAILKRRMKWEVQYEYVKVLNWVTVYFKLRS